MKKRGFFVALSILLMFIIWTVLLQVIDVKPIGPNGSEVGFATVNQAFHNFTGNNMVLYNITDWLGLVPIFTAFCFAVLGLVQWIKRRGILKVDMSILILGAYYTVVIAVYILFEYVVVNYRPILINGYLEPSYPSSTTLLVMCVMPAAVIQLNLRIGCKAFGYCVTFLISAFTVFMVVGRLISGVHWLSDIVGGTLLSCGLLLLYLTIVKSR